MAKKRRKDKELARLRREVEVLRAQLPKQRTISTTKAPEAPEPAEPTKMAKPPEEPRVQPLTQSVDPKFIKADLLKSGILTLIACGIIAALAFIL